jgi:hypothetical protein
LAARNLASTKETEGGTGYQDRKVAVSARREGIKVPTWEAKSQVKGPETRKGQTSKGGPKSRRPLLA